MKNPAIAVTALGMACIACACVSESQTPAARAASAERLRCSDPRVSQNELRVLSATTVIEAEPIYFHLSASQGSGEKRVSGAKLLVRQPDGVSSDEMTQMLLCHSAKALLGQVDMGAFPNDPYFLPDAWVDIDVKPENGFLAVRISADKVWQNLEVLHRATAFADVHRAVVGP
jgi:hypothetical protein